MVVNDSRTGMPPGIPEGAMCVQRFDDSLNSAIHTTYRISLRSSSMREPRDPLLKVLTFFSFYSIQTEDIISILRGYFYPSARQCCPAEATGKCTQSGYIYNTAKREPWTEIT